MAGGIYVPVQGGDGGVVEIPDLGGQSLILGRNWGVTLEPFLITDAAGYAPHYNHLTPFICPADGNQISVYSYWTAPGQFDLGVYRRQAGTHVLDRLAQLASAEGEFVALPQDNLNQLALLGVMHADVEAGEFLSLALHAHTNFSLPRRNLASAGWPLAARYVEAALPGQRWLGTSSSPSGSPFQTLPAQIDDGNFSQNDSWAFFAIKVE